MFLLVSLLSLAPAADTGWSALVPQAATLPVERKVSVNGQRLDDATLMQLQLAYGAIPDGAYWYDAACGAWGVIGQPAAGFIAAGLALPGPLPADASGTGSGWFVNGRELHASEAAGLAPLGLTAGRYTLDAFGNLGKDGQLLLNLAALAQQPSQGGPHRNDLLGYGMNSAGGSGYIMFDDGASVSW